MRCLWTSPHTLIFFIGLSASYVTAVSDSPVGKGSLVPRARVENCTPAQNALLEETLKAIRQISIFAVRLANVHDITVSPAGTLDGGPSYDEEDLRVFYRYAREDLEDLAGGHWFEARRSIARRFRNLKWEAERSEGGVYGATSEGRALLLCDNDRTHWGCRVHNGAYPFTPFATAYALSNLVLLCPEFFSMLRWYPRIEGRPSHVDELALQMLVTNAVRQTEIIPTHHDATAGPQHNNYRLQNFIQRLFILSRRYLVPQDTPPYQITPE